MTKLPDNIYCPNQECTYFGRIDGDNIRVRRVYGIAKDRIMYYFKTCGKQFAATTNTPMFHAHLPHDKVASIIEHVTRGVNVNSTSELVGVSPKTVNRYILLVGQHAQKVMDEVITNIHLTEVQLDELWTFVQRKTAIDEADANSGHGEKWIWTSVETVSRLVLAYKVGRHTLEEAREILLKTVQTADSDIPPLFVTDELSHYSTVLGEMFSSSEPVPPTGKPGRPAKPKQVIDPDLHYATVKKTRKGGSVVKVERTVVFGTMEGVQARLANSPSKKINTSYVERINLDLREWDPHLSRKTMAFAKDFDWLEAKLSLAIFR
jgi:IS1 family transposase/transposase-like protein